MNIFAVNVVGPSLLTAAALQCIEHVGHKPVAGLSHYGASKAALEHLTRC